MGEVRGFSLLKLKGIEGFIPFILFFIYAVGYSYVNGFYSVFNIDIEFYISVTDLFYYSLFVFLSFFIAYWVTVSFMKILEVFLSLMFKIFSKKLDDRDDIRLKSILIGLFILFLVINYFLEIEDFTGLFYVLLWAIPSVFIIFIQFFLRDLGSIKNVSTIIFGSIMILVVSYSFGEKQGTNLKNEPNRKQLSFFHEGTAYSTNNNLKFIGETSDYLFIYHQNGSRSMIFLKSDISKFTVRLK